MCDVYYIVISGGVFKEKSELTHLNLLSIHLQGGNISKRLGGNLGCKDKTVHGIQTGFLENSERI